MTAYAERRICACSVAGHSRQVIEMHAAAPQSPAARNGVSPTLRIVQGRGRRGQPRSRRDR
jgi:hypothetical protein